jgi:hypothetical protein
VLHPDYKDNGLPPIDNFNELEVVVWVTNIKMK